MASEDPTVPSADDVLTRIGQAVAAAGGGDTDGARATLEALWVQARGPTADALHQLAIAHALADLQDDPREELAWDLLALQAAADVTDERVARSGMPGRAAALYPSLHHNLGEDYRTLGELEAARRHAALGLDAVVHLGDDGYSRMITAGLQRLRDRLAELPE